MATESRRRLPGLRSYPFTLEENIAFGAVEQIQDHAGVVDAARRAGALNILDDLSGDWQRVLTRSVAGGTDLSGGQWQRIAFLLVLFATSHGAGVLILDEPTASLDARGEAACYDEFLSLTHGLTTILISHRFSTVRLADHICVLDRGQLVEEGDHDELMALNGRYACWVSPTSSSLQRIRQ